jgi:hypothetical protein
MITSTSTAIQDFNFLESLGDNIDVQNAQTQNLLEKYGSIENFKQAFRNETQGQNFDSNLPITTMAEGAMSSAPNLRELPTGDAGMAESMSPQLSEGTRSGSNINQQVVPSDKNLPLSKDLYVVAFGP